MFLLGCLKAYSLSSNELKLIVTNMLKRGFKLYYLSRLGFSLCVEKALVTLSKSESALSGDNLLGPRFTVVPSFSRLAPLEEYEDDADKEDCILAFINRALSSISYSKIKREVKFESDVLPTENDATCAIRSLPGGITGSCLFLGDPCGVTPVDLCVLGGNCEDPTNSPESLLSGENVLCGGLLERYCEDVVADADRRLIISLSLPCEVASVSVEANLRFKGLISRRDRLSPLWSSGGGLKQ